MHIHEYLCAHTGIFIRVLCAFFGSRISEQYCSLFSCTWLAMSFTAVHVTTICYFKFCYLEFSFAIGLAQKFATWNFALSNFQERA